MPGPFISDLLPQLSADGVIAIARAIEAVRGDDDEVLWGWYRMSLPAFSTPFRWQTGVVARELGIVAADPAERALVLPRELGALGADDMPVGKDLARAALGFAWWPGISEWEVMHTARLTRAAQAFIERWLGELGRLDDDALEIDRDQPRAHDRQRLKALDAGAREASVRLERLQSDTSRRLVDKGLEVLGYELYAYRAGTFAGNLIEPTGPYLDLAVAADYARAHQRRLAGPAFRRWLEHCLRPGVDYALDPIQHEERVARLLARWLVPVPALPEADLEAARARRVLVDVGWRLCHADGEEAALVAVSDAIVACDRGAAGGYDALLAAALERVAADPSAARVLALGYGPMMHADHEPTPARRVRALAAVKRAWVVHPGLGAALEGAPAIADALVAGPRFGPFRTQLEKASVAGPKHAEGYFSALSSLLSLGDEEPEEAARRWHYRLALREVPETDHAAYEVALNPYLQRAMIPFDAPWAAELFAAQPGAAPTLRIKESRATWYAFAGPGRAGPVVVPLEPRRSALIHALRKPQRLDALVTLPGIDGALVRRAVAEEIVLVFHRPPYERPERRLDFYDQVLSETDEPAGAWDDPEQAATYEAFNEVSDHYREASRALCDVARIEPAMRVAELGFGSGVTAREILSRLGPEGRLVAADPAPLLVSRIVFAIPDERARFVVGGARTLAWEAHDHGAFDRVVASASLWLTASIQRALVALGRALKPGGRLAVSLPAELLGYFGHRETPAMRKLSATLAEVRRALGIGEEVRGEADPALGSPERFSEALREAGFGAIDVTLYERHWTVGEYLAWLAMPVVADSLAAPADKARVPELLEATAARVDKQETLRASWYLVTADRR